jgi:hypothetical protein
VTEDRARADRITEEATQRRRRNDSTIDGSQRKKLAIPPEVEQRLKAEGRTPRWAIKDSARMLQLTQQDDYDPVDGVATVPTRNLADGARVEMILLSKPSAFINEDKAKAEKTRGEIEAAAVQGRNPTDPNAANASFYADEANSISRGGSRSP